MGLYSKGLGVEQKVFSTRDDAIRRVAIRDGEIMENKGKYYQTS